MSGRSAIPRDGAGPDQLSEADALFVNFAKTRDQKVFEQLISGHLDAAYSQARHLLNSTSDAEDAVQDALVQLVRTSGRFDGSIPFGAWFGRLVQLSALQFRRSRGRRAVRERKLAPMVPDHEEADPEILAQVRQAVGDLPETLRLPMALHYLGGLSQQETARALNITVDNLGMRLHRARKKLRRMLAKSGFNLSVAGIATALSTTSPLAAPKTLLLTIHGLVPSLAAQPAVPALGLHGLLGHKAVIAAALAAAAVLLAAVLVAPRTTRQAVGALPAPAARIASTLPTPPPRTMPVFNGYDLPAGAHPGSIVAAADGSVWFQSILLNPRRASIFHLAAAGVPTLVLPPIPSALRNGETQVGYIDSLATDDAGNLWTLEPHSVVRLDAQGLVTRFPMHDEGAPVRSQFGSIIIGPGGEPWFTDQGTSSIGTLDVATGTITRYPTGLDYVVYDSLAYEPGGDVYGLIDQNVYAMTPTGRPFLVTPVPAFPAVHLFHALVYGPDHALWFVDIQNDVIYRMTTAGRVSAFPVPTPLCAVVSIAVGRDGTLVFAEQRANRIGTISPDGGITEYALPVVGGPTAATVAADGTIWIADSWARKIVRLRR